MVSSHLVAMTLSLYSVVGKACELFSGATSGSISLFWGSGVIGPCEVTEYDEGVHGRSGGS